MKKVCAGCLTLGLMLSAAMAKSGTGGFGGFGPTLGFVNFSGINTPLKNQGFNELDALHWGMGGAGYAFVRSVVIGGSGWSGTQTVANDSVRCQVLIGGGQFEAGYVLYGSKHLIVAPMLGIGGAAYTITLEPTGGDVPNFEELLRDPGRKSDVSFSSFAFVPELAVTVPISFVGLQLKAGYNFLPVPPAWKLSDNARLHKGPAVSNGFPFVSLNIILGGMGREQD